MTTTMQKYEEMLLTDKDGLEKLIEDLTEKSINNDTNAKVKLEEISKYIDYEVELQATFNYEPPYLIGTAEFSSMEAVEEAKESLSGWDSFDTITNKFNVCWDGEPSDGDITIDDAEVSAVNVWGLNEDNCCEEALKREEVQKKAARNRSKQERIARLQEELENLKQDAIV